MKVMTVIHTICSRLGLHERHVKVQEESCQPVSQHSGAKHAVCKEGHGSEASRVPTAAVKDGGVPSLHTTKDTPWNKKRIRPHTAAAVHQQLSKRLQVALAESLSGRVICKAFKSPVTRKRQQYLGKLEFTGACRRAVLLQVIYEDCTAEDITLAQATALLMPEGTEMPQPCGTTATLQQLPTKWDLCDGSVLWQAMQLLMPGSWFKTHVTKVAAELVQAKLAARTAPEQLECVETTAEEVQHLLAYLPLTWARHVLEPFNGQGNISTALLQHGCSKVTTNDLCRSRKASMHQDALQPGFFAAAASKGGEAVDVIVTSPWFTVVDLAVPLMVASGPQVVAVHVSGRYLSSGAEPRLAYLRALQSQRRVAYLMGLPSGKQGPACMWLLVFRDMGLRDQLLVAPREAGRGLLILSIAGY